ncbi:MAG: hypothetical protein SPK52_06915 [Synergistales bacterium]|nr:hypothetical protein [Bacteroidales bacterium]MDY6435929.1 hypothetical protein [Synergistales bacterium]MDY6394606.1 hypothetical protein [Bacteroidales bacterium]MDY6395940.1 hypothetical protein [Bacteroidales bacterium]MDY6403773.1 hypothetical protein [Bacteroidales bacterium]
MKTLKLVLKKKWFDMIASGEKTEEYRETTPYWKKRLCPCNDYDFVTFYLGYRKNRPQKTFRVKYITKGRGKEEWGAKKDKNYFIIKLGERIK